MYTVGLGVTNPCPNTLADAVAEGQCGCAYSNTIHIYYTYTYTRLLKYKYTAPKYHTVTLPSPNALADARERKVRRFNVCPVNDGLCPQWVRSHNDDDDDGDDDDDDDDDVKSICAA